MSSKNPPAVRPPTPVNPPGKQEVVPAGAGQVPPTTGKELVGVDFNANLAPANPVAKMFVDMPGREDPTFIPLIKIDHREGVFVLPSGEIVSSVEGCVIKFFQVRSYYKDAYKPGTTGVPPDCFSSNLIEPDVNVKKKVSASCLTCPMAQFGSHRMGGNSQACAVYTWLFLFNPTWADAEVRVLRAPPSSIKSLIGGRFDNGFVRRAKAMAGAFELAWGKFTLLRTDPNSPHVVVESAITGIIKDEERAMRVKKALDTFSASINEIRKKAPETDLPPDEGE